MFTPFDRPTTCLLIGVLVFLAIATVVSAAIRKRSRHPEGANNLIARVGSWWVMVALFVGALLFGRIGATVFFSVVALFGLRELVRLRGDSTLRSIAILGVALLPCFVFLIVRQARGRELLIYLVIVTEMSDVLQYCWGKLFGKHRIVPRVSPNKTWEGFIGGVLSATALGAALKFLTPFTLTQSGMIALIIAIAGFFGGLMMSAIKRDAGVKDFGTLIPGHGGVMDRIDSLTLAVPVFYLLVRFGGLA